MVKNIISMTSFAQEAELEWEGQEICIMTFQMLFRLLR